MGTQRETTLLSAASGYPTPVLDAFGRFPDRAAFVHQGKPTTYREALGEVYRLAHALDSCGLGRGDGVALLTNNQPHQFLAGLATQLLGCRHIAAVDPAFSAAEQAHILRDADVAAFIYAPQTHSAHAAEVLALVNPSVVLSLGPAALGTDLLELAAGFPPLPIPPRAEPDDIARLVYTGGSTGRSKGCCHTFGALSVHWAWQPPRWSTEIATIARASRRYLVTGSNTGAAGNDFMAPALLSGGTVYLHDSFDAGATLQTVERERITAMFVGTAKLNPLLDHPTLDRMDLRSLCAVVSGSAITTQRFQQAIDRFGPILYQAYGQSEAGLISMLTPDDLRGGPKELLRSAGRPQPGVTITVQDPNGNQLDIGESGEICVRTPQLMTGYWRRPELSAQALHNGWLHTGDIGYLDADGYLYLLDRVKDMVIVRGENCFSHGIEDVLTRHPGVRQAAVIAVPHEVDGEAVHAVVVTAPGALVTPTELLELVTTELSPLHAPKSVAFVDELPLTPAGKVDKKKLRAPFWVGQERQIR